MDYKYIIDWENFKKYLEDLPLRPRSVKIYLNRLHRVLNGLEQDNFSRESLILCINEIIYGYSEEGIDYDPQDHGNTLAALRHLKEYLCAPYAERLRIQYNEGYQSFARIDRHVGAYTITANEIEITYYERQFPVKTVVKAINRKQRHALLDVLLHYRSVLSPSHTAICGFHGAQNYFEYELDDHTTGTCCAALFASADYPSFADDANNKFDAWLAKHI